MENFQLFLLVLQVVIASSLIILVLLQKSDGDSLSGIGGGSGGINAAISRRSAANILSKITITLIAIFMLNCLILAAISKSDRQKISEELNQTIKQEELQESEPKIPSVK